jgi:hypothetical protein
MPVAADEHTSVDGIARYAQVVVHAARDALAWSTTRCDVGVGGEGAPDLSEMLARRFERHRPRIRMGV